MTMQEPHIFKYLELVKQEHKALAGMSRQDRAAQLGYSSIDETFVPVLDALGQVRMSIGRQPDETYAIQYQAGEPPPIPTGFIVAPREGAALVGWDGTFGGYDKPGDFWRVDIHVSETPNFEPTGATVVGYLLGEAATLIPIDAVTHYFKFVAVNLGDVRSGASPEFAVLPEPIGAIAAGVIGADQLAATIVLSNLFIAGDPNAAHLSLNADGLKFYNNTLQRTINFDTISGDAEITGIIRTANSGRRMEWTPELADGFQGVQFFGDDPAFADNPAILYSADATATSGTLADSGPSLWMQGPVIDNGRTAVSVSRNVEIQYTRQSNSAQLADFRFSELGISGIAGIAYADPGGNYVPGTWYGYMQIMNPQENLVSNPSAFLGYMFNDSGGVQKEFGFDARYKANVSYAFGGGFGVVDQTGTTWRDATAREFLVASSRDAKEDIQPLPFSALDSLRAAPVSTFQYSGDEPDDPTQMGIMAEDLPTLINRKLLRPTGDYINGISNSAQIAWLAAAVRELDIELDAVRSLLPPGKTKKIERVIREDAT